MVGSSKRVISTPEIAVSALLLICARLTFTITLQCFPYVYFVALVTYILPNLTHRGTRYE